MILLVKATKFLSKKWRNGKWTDYKYKQSTPRSKRIERQNVKSLANEADVAHSVEMIRTMYRKRDPGKGFECEIASKADLKVILNKTTFALLSAGKNPEDPEDMKLTDEDIKVRTAELRADLLKSGYVITKTNGMYDLPEDSVMFMTHDADKREVMAIGKKYKQDSVIFAQNGKQDMIFTAGPNAGKSDMSGQGFEMNQKAKNYYTEVKVGGKWVKFSLLFGNLAKAIRLILNV